MSPRRFLPMILATSCLLITACNPLIEGMGIRLQMDRRLLTNGLNVLLIEDHTVPVVSYQTWYRAGSVDESYGTTGISHLFEHLMFKGTVTRGPGDFFKELENRGAEVNGFTSRDYTVYYETFAPDLLPKVIEMEADRMENLLLTEQTLGAEKLIVSEERRLRMESSPDSRMQEALWELAFRRHPYQWPVIGYPQDTLSISLEQVKAHFKTYYQPANATVLVVGDFDKDRLLTLLRKHYENIPAGAAPKRNIPREPPQEEERRLVLSDQVASEKLAQAYAITEAGHPDSAALDVLANILFGGTSSRAYQLLVEERNLAISVTGSSYTPTYPGLFLVSATMRGDLPASSAEAALDSILTDIQEKGVTPEEVQIAVKQLSVQLIDSIRTPHGMGQLVGTVQMIFGDPKRFSEDIERYFKVTPEDVRRVAKQYLIPNNRVVVTLKRKV